MYQIQSKKSSFDIGAYNFVLSLNYGAKHENSSDKENLLRKIADQSFDLLSQVQKLDKLSKLGHLNTSEKAEFQSMIRLVGVMIHILSQYGYSDKEMMDALNSRFLKFESSAKIIAV